MKKKTFGIIGICLILIFSVLGYPVAKGATPDKIAYVHGNAIEQPNAIWVMDSDGTNRHQITIPPENSWDLYPTWSPDGRKIAFSRGEGVVSHIFIINSDGTNEQQITFGDVSDDSPAWSPDGTRIAYTHFISEDSEENGMWIMNADGTGAHQIASNGFGESNYDPSWFPDGTEITYVHYYWEIGEDIWIMDADGSNPRQLTDSGRDETPAWSPLGTRIAFLRHLIGGGRIYVINTDGSDETPISNPPQWWDDDSPAWSPNGTRIAFERQFPDATEAEIWVMDADGGNPHMINEAGYHPAWWGPMFISEYSHRVNLPSLLPLASNNIAKGNGLVTQAGDLLTQAKSRNLDTATCEKLIDGAKLDLAEARTRITSPITANYYALKAIEKLKDAIDCLKTLLK